MVTDSDFPWLYGRVVARPGFAEVRPLFVEELPLIDEIDSDDGAAWDAVYARIRATVRLVYPDGRNVPEFILHIDGDLAWWRWSDESFAT